MEGNRYPPESLLSMLEEGKLGAAEVFKLLREGSENDLQAAERGSADRDVHLSAASDALRELDAMVGLGEVKALVHELRAFIEVQRRRARAGLSTEPMVLHMVFRGNPGTGKTTVARIIGRLFRDLGVLQKGHLVEVERADLVGEYIGHTAQRTREQIKRALGGILFIDEAYSLARGGEKDFGKEAIDTLVKAMEDHKDNLILILAGYQDEMEKFLRTNPGLRSRFPIHIDFPDYTVDELLEIAEAMLARRQYRLTDEARALLLAVIWDKMAREVIPGNARLVRNIIEKAIRRQAVRLYSQGTWTRDDLMTITRAEIEQAV